MRTRFSPLVLTVALGTGLATLAHSSPAHALGPVDIEAAARAGYTTKPGGDLNPLGIGVGGRAGVSIFGVYGGLSMLYQVGESSSVAGSDVSVHSLLYGVDVGYDIKLLPIFKLRPQVGVGNLTVTASGGGSAPAVGVAYTVAGSSSYLYVEPGVVGVLKIGTLLLGADATALLLPSYGDGFHAAIAMHGQIGVAF